jgi:hypothetical protein
MRLSFSLLYHVFVVDRPAFCYRFSSSSSIGWERSEQMFNLRNKDMKNEERGPIRCVDISAVVVRYSRVSPGTYRRAKARTSPTAFLAAQSPAQRGIRIRQCSVTLLMVNHHAGRCFSVLDTAEKRAARGLLSPHTGVVASSRHVP